MSFFSTRGGACVTASQSILWGLAADGGLYVPSLFPQISSERLAALCGQSYRQRAARILRDFLEDYSIAEIEQSVDAAYAADAWDHPDVAPVRTLIEGVHVLELFHGPTLAFKDIALKLLPYLVRLAAEKNGEKREVSIIVATSGDTGKAALEGFRDVPGTSCSVFYPYGGVSRVQELQMTTTGGNNTHVIGVRGNFDQAQTGVKRIFGDEAFARELAEKGVELSSANSINWGRLVPQVAYYFSAYADLLKKGVIALGDEVNFCVPTGNFGNILAAYYAKRMGVPLGMLYCASNENRVLTDFINTGTYDISERPFVLTPSPSMDILVSSNLERQLFELTGRDAEAIAGWMSDLREQRRFRVDEGTFARVREQFASDSIDNATCLDTIKRVFDEHDYLLDPHTAVAYRTAENLRGENPVLIASTAHWAKFGDNVYRALHGLEPGAALPADVAALSGCALNELIAQETGKHDIPRGLAELDALPIRFDEVIEGGTDSIEAAAARFLEELGAAAPGRDDRD